MHAEDNMDHVGIVLWGAVLIVKEDFAGNRSIVERIWQYEIFGEALAYAGIPKSPVTVAAESNEIMWIQFRRIVNTCSIPDLVEYVEIYRSKKKNRTWRLKSILIDYLVS